MLRFVDNFAIYGTEDTGRTNMLRTVAGWLEVDSSSGDDTWPVTTYARQNGTHSLHMCLNSTPTEATRFSLGGTVTTVIAGAAFRLAQLPSADDKLAYFNLLNAANAQHLTLCVDPSGRLRLLLGALGDTEIANSDALSPAPPITPGGFQFVEIKATIDDAAGAVVVRVNEQTVINVSGVDTKGAVTAGCAMVSIGRMLSGGIATGDLHIADLYACDNVGDNADFLGDTEWVTVMPDADANAIWTPGSEASPPAVPATRYEAVDETTPDDDGTFIESTDSLDATGQLFNLSALPAGTSEVVGVCTRPLIRKVDAGTSGVTVGLRQTDVSPDVDADAAEYAPTEDYLYTSGYHDVDPGTGVRFTPETFATVQLKIQRTA